jgi:hypothetical protein
MTPAESTGDVARVWHNREYCCGFEGAGLGGPAFFVSAGHSDDRASGCTAERLHCGVYFVEIDAD